MSYTAYGGAPRRRSKQKRYNPMPPPRASLESRWNAAAWKTGYRTQGKLRRVGAYGRYNRGLGGELKWKDFAVTVDPLATVGSITDSLVVISQGTGGSQRLGRKAVIKSIALKGVFKLDDKAATDATSHVFRIIIYVDKQTNGATAAVLDLLTTAAFNSFRSLDNTGRFRVLMDKTFVMNKEATLKQDDAPYTFSKEKICNWFKRMNLPIVYDSTDGTIDEQCCNNIGMLIICNSAVSTPRFDGNFRIRFQG